MNLVAADVSRTRTPRQRGLMPMNCRHFPSPHPMGRGIKGEGFMESLNVRETCIGTMNRPGLLPLRYLSRLARGWRRGPGRGGRSCVAGRRFMERRIHRGSWGSSTQRVPISPIGARSMTVPGSQQCSTSSAAPYCSMTLGDWGIHPISVAAQPVIEATLSAAKILTSQGLLG